MAAARLTLDEFTLQALPEERTWSGRPAKADLAALPASAAVYLLLADQSVPVQLATTQHLRRLAQARLCPAASVSLGKVDLAAVVRGIRWRRACSAFEGRWWYYRLARHLYPAQYPRLVSFGPAWFLHIDREEGVPDIRVTERIWHEPGEYVGPWLTHDSALNSLAGLRDLFDLCRYPEQVRRAPRGQRCAYADMDRCDAPCDGTAPLERYRERVRAAWAFAGGAVRPWIDAAKQRMKLAAAEQRFEQAALLKHQLAFAWKWHDGMLPWLRPAARLNYLLAVPVLRRRTWKLFLFRQGGLSEGPVLSGRQLAGAGAAWAEAEWARGSQPLDLVVRMEQTWLVAHFLRSREGDASLICELGENGPAAGLRDELRTRLAQREAERALAADSAPGAESAAVPQVAPDEPAAPPSPITPLPANRSPRADE